MIELFLMNVNILMIFTLEIEFGREKNRSWKKIEDNARGMNL